MVNKPYPVPELVALVALTLEKNATTRAALFGRDACLDDAEKVLRAIDKRYDIVPRQTPERPNVAAE